MRTFVLTIAVAAAAAMLAAPALAAYAPHLLVTTNAPTASGAPSVTLEIRATPQDDPTAHLDVYVPKGYGTILGAKPGTRVGNGTATVVAGGAPVSVPATLAVGDPKQIDQGNACAPGPHEALWLLALKPPAGSPLVAQIYVDPADDLPDAVLKLQTCLPSPADKAANPLGAQVTGLRLTLDGVLRSPATGEARWRSIFTPYDPGTTNVDALNTVEADALVRAARVTVAARAAGSGRAAVTGAVTSGGRPAEGARVTLLRGTTARALRNAATVTTAASGRFATALAVRLGAKPGALYVAAQASSPPAEDATASCGPDSPFADQDVPCASSSANGFVVRSKALRVPLPASGARKR